MRISDVAALLGVALFLIVFWGCVAFVVHGAVT